MKKIMKKNKRISIQIGSVVTLLFFVTISLITIVVYWGTKDLFLRTCNERMTYDLQKLKNLNMNEEITGIVIDYWKNNPDVITEHSEDPLYLEFVKDFQKVSSLLANITPQMIEASSDEEKKALFKAMYTSIGSYFDEERKDQGFSRIICIDLSDDNYGKVLMFSDEHSEQTGEYAFGTLSDVYLPVLESSLNSETSDEYGGIIFSEVVLKTANSDSEHLYLGWIIHDTPNGGKYAVGVEYDWTDFADDLEKSFWSISLIGHAVVVVVNILLVIFIYYNVASPLKKVNKGVREYMEKKDSGAALKAMEAVRSRNEIGRLADSFAEMSEEIERYTEENLKLGNERERIAAELSLAANIQSSQLPSKFPAFPDRDEFDIFASMTPAKEVGGDFYDFFMIDGDHLGLVIADVSGKGVPAALFMMISKMMIKNYAMSGFSPAEVLEVTNESIYANNKEKLFVTVWFGILEISSGKITAANAGHEYPAVRQPNGRFELLKDKHGYMIGLRKNKHYTEYELELKKGATLFVYTDGVPEATDKDEELYGTDRMLEALNKEPDAAPEKLLENVHIAVNEFVGDAPQFDDLTMLALTIK